MDKIPLKNIKKGHGFLYRGEYYIRGRLSEDGIGYEVTRLKDGRYDCIGQNTGVVPVRIREGQRWKMAKKRRGYVDPIARGVGFEEEELPKPGSKEFDRLTTSMAKEMRREIDKEVRKSKNAMKAFLRRLNIADTRTVFRCHRFVISGDKAFLLVNRVYLSRNEVIVRFYLTEETLAFIAAKKWPKDLRIELLSGTGDIKGIVLLYGVRFIRNVVESLQFDYTKTDILTMDVRLSFKKAYLDTVGCLDKKEHA